MISSIVDMKMAYSSQADVHRRTGLHYLPYIYAALDKLSYLQVFFGAY